MNTYLRQNHKEPLTYLKAATYCFKKERMVTYFIIVLSVLICFAGIFNKYLTFFVKNLDTARLQNIQARISEIINLVSGTFIICQIIVNKQMRFTHRLGVNLMERYDCYVYDIPVNKILMMHVTDSDIEALARKIKKNLNQYYNYYFSSAAEAEGKYVVFENQYKLYKNEYKLMNFVKPFYLVIWISFVVSIVILAVSFDDRFVLTLINTLIPSLSILSIIMSSANAFNESLSKLRNGIGAMDNQRSLSKAVPQVTPSIRLNSNHLLRNNQDGLFIVRQSSFTIPVYFHKRFLKYEQKMSLDITETNNPDKKIKSIFPQKKQPVKTAPKTLTTTKKTVKETPKAEPVKPTTKEASKPVQKEIPKLPAPSKEAQKSAAKEASKESFKPSNVKQTKKLEPLKNEKKELQVKTTKEKIDKEKMPKKAVEKEAKSIKNVEVKPAKKEKTTVVSRPKSKIKTKEEIK